MNIEKTNLSAQIVKQAKSEVGTVHFFKDLAVVEFYEGVHIDIATVKKTISDLIDYFGQSKPFGIIANRINSYSVALLDIKDARLALPNLKAYGIVSYSSASRMSAEIESSICEWKDICFDNLHEGLDTIYKRVKDSINVSLN
ncbi:hypothetical protein [Winogradskyella sp.]|uniref:hypothetical protein n=1 Tax=Winogradskyella sp. TaxID=1883156 RepID=UPI0025FE292D|nr:hypothetical protein [Winogradskyella sp.]